MTRKKISIVIPVYNEQDSLPLVYQEVSLIMDACKDTYASEIIFVDDGSVDNSWKVLEQLAACDSRVQCVKLTRNFGHQMALTAGYDYAHGDAVITMDADLQDPPPVIVSMIKEWENGAFIVYARRVCRQDSFFKRFTADIYYRFLHAVADVSIPRNVGDFRLLDKRVVHYVRDSKEKVRYLRGMVAWGGFRHAFVDFKRSPRAIGTSGYTLKKMIRLASDGLVNFSTVPLKISGVIGLCMTVITMGVGIYKAVAGLQVALEWHVLGLYLCAGSQFIVLWFLGEYVGRIYEQQKDRPLYIIEEHKGVQKVLSYPVVSEKKHDHENRTTI